MSASELSTSNRTQVLLQNLRDVTLHCLQLVKVEDLDELNYWLIRRRAFMDEIDDIQDSTSGCKQDLPESNPNDLYQAGICDIWQVIETLDHELQLTSIELRDKYQYDFKTSHEQAIRLNSNSLPFNGDVFDLIG